MEWDVVHVQVTGPHLLFVKFRDGVEGEVQFKPSFFRGVFAHLADDQEFSQVRLVDGAVTWPQELDLAPDAMHDALKTRRCWVVE